MTMKAGRKRLATKYEAYEYGDSVGWKRGVTQCVVIAIITGIIILWVLL